MIVGNRTAALPGHTARLFFRHHIENGASVSVCLAVVALAAGALGGMDAAVFASIGAMCVSIVDQPGPLPGKLRILTAALLGSSLISLLAGLASGAPLAMAGVVTLTSLGLAMATAFGRPALMLGITGVLALIIGMAIPAGSRSIALLHAGLFFAGGLGYGVLAMLASWGFDDRNRRMFLNEALLSFAAYLRARAQLYDRTTPQQAALAGVIEAHGVLMERMQGARDTIFTGRETPKRRKWVAGMLALLDLYEAVLSSDADWEALREAPDNDALQQISALSRTIAADIEAVALTLVSPAADMPACAHDEMLAALDATLRRLDGEEHQSVTAGLVPTRNKLARTLRRTQRLAAVLARDAEPTKPLSRKALSAFVQPRAPLLATLRGHLRLTSPVTRYAIRLTLAMLAGYGVTLAFPAYVHGGWILLTVALIMRASYAITRQRRNDRIVGTLAGCAAAAVLIPILPQDAVVTIVILGVGLAHAYGAVNYKVTSFAASMMALLLLHFLEPQTFFVTDRIIDTLAGAGLSVVFARVLPSWEWRDVPRLIDGLVAADRAFADASLTRAPDDQAYRLARKRALDGFTALATITRRLASEPRGRRRKFTSLNDLLAANYLFASDLASVHAMLLARAAEIDAQAVDLLLGEARGRVLESLSAAGAMPPPETLRRRGWFELRGTQPLPLLRRRLLHIEHSARRLAAQAARARQDGG